MNPLEQRRDVTRAYPLTVAYDGQAFLSANGGTGKGLQLKNLLGPYADHFLGFATKGRNYSDRLLIQGGFAGHQLWQQLSLPWFLQKWHADYFLAPYNIAPLFVPQRTKLILVLHDLILLERFATPSLKQKLNNEFRRFLIPRAVGRAHIVLTVSDYTKQQIQQRFPYARIEVIPCTIAHSWFIAERSSGIGQKENYVLSVVGNAAHKNSRGALEGFAKFVSMVDRSTAPRLRLVGLSDAAEEYQRHAKTLAIEELVDIEPYLTESQLQELYRRARALLIPSLMEGFGIPVLEAMASGTPVLASNTTSLPEVGGNAAAYFNPTDTSEMAETLAQVLGEPARQQRMIEQGFLQARQFHPEIVGARVRKFWDDLAEGARFPSPEPDLAANASVLEVSKRDGHRVLARPGSTQR